jgi:hypothetical protein
MKINLYALKGLKNGYNWRLIIMDKLQIEQIQWNLILFKNGLAVGLGDIVTVFDLDGDLCKMGRLTTIDCFFEKIYIENENGNCKMIELKDISKIEIVGMDDRRLLEYLIKRENRKIKKLQIGTCIIPKDKKDIRNRKKLEDEMRYQVVNIILENGILSKIICCKILNSYILDCIGIDKNEIDNWEDVTDKWGLFNKIHH